MPSLTAPQLGEKYVVEVRRVAVSFAGLLDDGETLTVGPIITSLPAGVAISGEQFNGAAIVVNGVTVDANEVALFLVSAGAADTFYDLSVAVSSSNGQQFTRVVRLKVLANPS